jgi:hypothetical protein
MQVFSQTAPKKDRITFRRHFPFWLGVLRVPRWKGIIPTSAAVTKAPVGGFYVRFGDRLHSVYLREPKPYPRDHAAPGPA